MYIINFVKLAIEFNYEVHDFFYIGILMLICRANLLKSTFNYLKMQPNITNNETHPSQKDKLSFLS